MQVCDRGLQLCSTYVRGVTFIVPFCSTRGILIKARVPLENLGSHRFTDSFSPGRVSCAVQRSRPSVCFVQFQVSDEIILCPSRSACQSVIGSIISLGLHPSHHVESNRNGEFASLAHDISELFFFVSFFRKS